MKKLVILMSFGLILLTGCSKEDSSDPNLEQSADSVYVLNESNGMMTWEAMEVNLPEANSLNNGDVTRGNSAHAHGDYTGGSGSFTIGFSGTQNNGGAHGSAEIRLAGGPYEAHFILETTSMVVNGDEAIYGGVITEVVTNTFPTPPPPPPPPPCPTFPNCPPPPPPPSCNPNSVGNYVYFKVIDNGQGNNAPTDQYQGMFQSCNELGDGAASFPWFIFGPAMDVENSRDKIKVN